MQKIRVLRRELQRYSTSVEKRFGVTSAQLALLIELHSRSGQRLLDLQNKIGIHQTTASNMVAQLLRRGLIAKLPHETDKRGVVLELTENGRKFVEEENGPITLSAKWAGHFEGLDPETLSRVNDGLNDLLGIVTEISEFCEQSSTDRDEESNSSTTGEMRGKFPDNPWTSSSDPDDKSGMVGG